MSASDSPTVAGLPAGKLLAAALGSSPESTPAFAWLPPDVEEVAGWFPDYEVQSLAGRGAMGAVYRAVQKKLGRSAAVKILPAELAAREGVGVRFEREARALAQLNHPGIVTLYDFGRTENGHLYIVMEYVDGTDLSRLLRTEGGTLSVPQALEIVSQICDALQYAHNHGFVHRDIKPGNVLVDREGRVKIADFGLAKLVSGDGAAERTENAGRVTLTGQAVGTPDYTAPEQLRGGPVDHRADIYSLGVMFYEMLTGDLPRGAWALPSERTAVPAGLDEVVQRALQTEPDRRYQQASEVKAAMAETGSGERGREATKARWLPVWAAPALQAAGIVLISVSHRFLVAGGILVLAAPAVWLYQKPRRRWMAGALAMGLACGAWLFADGLKKLMSSTQPEAGADISRRGAAAAGGLEVIGPAQRGGRVKRVVAALGQKLVPGSIAAELDPAPILLELEVLKTETAERLEEVVAQLNRETQPLEAELRRLQTTVAEDSAVIRSLERQLQESDEHAGRLDAMSARLLQNDSERQKARTELAKAKARDSLSAAHMAELHETLTTLRGRRDAAEKSARAVRQTAMADHSVVSLLPLSAEERRRYEALRMALEECLLKTVRGGTVVRVAKQEGEFCAAGETVLTISGDHQEK